MKEALAHFGRLSVKTGRQPVKYYEGSKAAVEVTSKDIFVGSGGNWKLKWKDVLTLETDDDGFALESEHHIVHANSPARDWLQCRRLMERCWNKRQEKDRKQKEEEEEEQREAKRPRSYRGKSYSKRPNKFLAKNASNILEWDSEDDTTFNRVHQKKPREEEEAGQSQEIEPEEEDTFEEEQEATFEEEQEATFEEDDASMQPVEEEMPPEEEEHPETKRCTKRRRFKRKQQHDEDSDDDDLFKTPVLTIPNAAQRIVSPTTATTSPRHALDDDEEEEKTNEQVDEEVEEDRSGLQDITNYFTPRVTPGTTERKPSKPVAEKQLPSPSRQENQAPLPPPSFQENQAQEASESHEELPKKPKSNFFAPRRLNPKFLKRDDAPSDVSTVVPSPSSTQLTDEMDNKESTDRTVTTPKNSQTKSYAFAYESAKKLEEDDPIVDDSPMSSRDAPSSQARFIVKKRLFKKTYSKRPQPPASTATMALELAETRSPKLSPLATTFASTLPKSPKKSAPLAPLPTWRGLRNLGNTCYMNASLQMIFSVPKFVEAINASQQGRRLVSGICSLWHDLADRSKRASATARTIKSAVDDETDKFRGYQQRDAHEFLGDLLDQIHEELEKPPKKNDNTEDEEKKEESDQDKEKCGTLPIDDFFRLDVEVCLKCKSCGYSRTKEEMYRYLSIDIADDTERGTDSLDHKRTVEKCLDHFFRPEDRELKCEKCDDGSVATQTMRILSRPKAMLLHLKRFVLVEKARAQTDEKSENHPANTSPGVEMTFRKNKAPVELTEQLSLDRFVAKSAETTFRGEKYTLNSIVHHIGSTANSGHYTADALRIRADETGMKTSWVSFDDGVTSETTSAAVRNSVQNQKSAYMLLYTTV